MEIICKDRVFTLKNGSDVLLHTDANTPMVYVGYGEERVEMYRGNFKLEDHLLERRPGWKLPRTSTSTAAASR